MRPPKKILLTGYGPFENHKKNPSEALVQSLSKIFKGDRSIECLTLPTDYRGGWQEIQTSLEHFKPDIILSFGLASRRRSICLEGTAYNETSLNRADTAGYNPISGKISSNGPDILKSTLPLTKLQKHLASQGFPARISRNAGNYVCNYTLYKLLEHAQTKAPDMKAAFIHIPKPLSKGPMTMGTIENASLSIIDYLR